jgi:hypothetical protein
MNTKFRKQAWNAQDFLCSANNINKITNSRSFPAVALGVTHQLDKLHAAPAAQLDSITSFTSWLQQNHVDDTTAKKLRLCRVHNFCTVHKGSPSPTWKLTNKTYWIAGKLINNITLLALKCFCTRWDVQPYRYS